MDEDFIRECESAIQDRDLKIGELLNLNRSKIKEIEDLQTKIERNPNDDNLAKELEELLMVDQSNLLNIVSSYKIMRPNLKRMKENLLSTKEKINKKIRSLTEHNTRHNFKNIFNILAENLAQIDSAIITKSSSSQNNESALIIQNLEAQNKELNTKLSIISKGLTKLSSITSTFTSFKSSILISLSKYRQEINQAQSLLIKPLLIPEKTLIMSQELKNSLKLDFSSKFFQNAQTLKKSSHPSQTEQSESLVETLDKGKACPSNPKNDNNIANNFIHFFPNPKALEENIETLYQSLSLPPHDPKESITTVKKSRNDSILETNADFLLPIQRSLDSLKIRLDKFENVSTYNLKKILEKIEIYPKTTTSTQNEEDQKSIKEKVKNLILLKGEEFKKRLSFYDRRNGKLYEEKGKDELAADVLYRKCLMRSKGKTLGRVFV